MRQVSNYTDDQPVPHKIQNLRQNLGQHIANMAPDRMRSLHSKGLLTDLYWIPAHTGVLRKIKPDILTKVATEWREKGKELRVLEPFCIYTLYLNIKRRILRMLHRP